MSRDALSAVFAAQSAGCLHEVKVRGWQAQQLQITLKYCKVQLVCASTNARRGMDPFIVDLSVRD